MLQNRPYLLMRPWLLAVVLAIMAMAAPPALASNFTIGGTNNTFIIKRDNTSTVEKVYYRTVGMSAVAGVHYTESSGYHVFQVGDDSYSVTVSEYAATSLADVYRFQTDNYRTYRFEVLDTRMQSLATKTRQISLGNEYKVPTTYLNKSVTDLIYFTSAGNFASGSGNKYLDVYNTDSQSGYTQVRDGGYGQGVHNIDVAPLFSSNDDLKNYFQNTLNCKMYATIGFTQKEENDGYQYIQILANNESTYDGTDSDGSVSTPSISLYKACFILSYNPSGSVMSDDHYQFFPHRYDYVDKATDISNGITHYEFDYDNSHLYRQAYRNTSFKANNSGSLVLPLTVNTLNVRFNAKGGGNDHDEWDFKNLFARLALVDETAPRQSANPVLNPGPYNVGSDFYVSVIFNEPVKYTTAPTLTTTWGTMTAMGGHGSNVLTFKGTISTSTTHGTALNVTALGGGTITDLAGNAYTGSVSQSFGSATAVARYSFNSATGALTLNWGEFNKDNKWGADVTPSAVTSVTATDEVSFSGDCSQMFYNFTNCTSIDLGQVDTKNCTNMGSMFYNCSSLTTLNVANWNTASVTNMSNLFRTCSRLTTLNVSGWNTAAVTNMSNLFRDCSSLTTLDVANWNTAAVTNMNYMFRGCSNLATLDVSEWNTASVTTMSQMFNNCSGLTTLDLSNWNTASVTNMSQMFYNCSGLTTLDLSQWNTGSVTNMVEMFRGCSTLATLDVSEWDTSSVTYMGTMFRECSGLTTLDLSNWDTSSVTSMSYMFYNCSGLTTLDLSNWNTAAVTNMVEMFYGCSSLATLDLSGWNTASVTNMNYMFSGCSSLTTIYAGSAWSTANVTSSNNMFNGCANLEGGMGTTFDNSNTNAEIARFDQGEDGPGYLTGVFTLALPDDVTTTTTPTLVHGGVNLYAGGTDITLAYNGTPPEGTRFDHFTVDGEPLEGDTFAMPFDNSEVGVEYLARYTFDSATGTLTLNWGEFNKDNKWGNDVPADDVLSVTATSEVSFTGDCSRMFYNFTNCTSIDLGQVNTDDCTDMSSMFRGCSSLTTLDVSNWNTAAVTNMSSMFRGCSTLTALDVSQWNTASVTNMVEMFSGCSTLTALDVSQWNTASVTTMAEMFRGCSTLAALDVSQWDTSSVTTMAEMFRGCSTLTTLDVSQWDTSSVTYMGGMFRDCSGLTTLDLSNWDTSSVTSMSYMLRACSSLATLDVSNWDTAAVTSMSQMFYDCSSLTTLDLSNWNTASVTIMTAMFYNCSSLTTIYAGSGWRFAHLNEMFNGCANLVGGMGTTYDSSNTDGAYARFDRGEDEPGYLTGVFTLTLPDDVTTTTTPTLVHGDVNLYAGGTDITLDYNGTPPDGTRFGHFTVDGEPVEGDTFAMPFDNSEVGVEYQARYTFDSATGTLTLNWGEFNKDNKWGNDVTPSAVTSVTATSDVSFTGDCYDLFYNFTNCTSMDLGDANTDALTGMFCMFYNCSSLTTLDLSNWNTASVTDMSSMFRGCSSLTTLDVSNWNTASVTNMSDMFHDCSGLTALDVSEWSTASAIDMTNMFYGCSSLTTLDLSEWNTASVTYMSGMFYNCSSLESLDVSEWNTASVTTMNQMFYNCSSLESLDVSEWDTASVTNMREMFSGCSTLATLDVSEWDTSSVTKMSYMFYNCSGLATLDVSNWDTSSVTSMSYMFYKCSGLTTLSLSNWNTASVTSMTYMFYGCSGLTTLDVSNWNTASVTDFGYMFRGCSGLTTIYAGSGWSTANVRNSSNMFRDCASLVGGNGTHYDGHNNDAAYARFDKGEEEPGYLTGVFTLTLPDDVTTTATPTLVHGDVNLYAGGTDITLAYNGTPPDGTRFGHFTVDGEPVEGDTFVMPMAPAVVGVECQARYTFDSTTGALTLNWGEFNKDDKWGNDVTPSAVTSVTATSDVSFTGNCYNLFYNFTNCTSMDLGDANTDALTSMFCMFYNCSSLTTLDLSNWNTASVTNMGSMFRGCSSLTTLDVSNWNTASVTNMSDMFHDCSGLTTLDVSNWNTASAIDMTNMFYGCSSLTTLDLSEWNTASVYHMDCLFRGCSGLTTLDVSNWDTSSVTNMGSMFYNCSGLTTLDVSQWNTASVTNMGSMFYNCSGLESLDVSGWNTASATSMFYMFYNCSSLTTIYAGSEWSTASVTSSNNMFNGCANLVGGMGTTYDSSDTDVAYARFDQGEDEPGYLTGVFTLTLPDDVTTTATPTLVHGDVNLYAGGTDITLAYNGTPPDGTRFHHFTVDGEPVEGDTFVMPMAPAVVGVEYQARYTFDSTTGELALLRGEFNKDNKWGNDVTPSAVTSVTATSDVSFTGDCYDLFYNFTNCTSMDLGDVNTDALTSMFCMFYNCSSLTTLDVSNWNTASVTDMSQLFMGCSGLASLDVSEWNTASVTDMGSMFYNCSSLTTLDVSNWNTASVTNMSQLFMGCMGLTTLDVSNFNTASVTNMYGMFMGCGGLTTLDVSNFNTAAVTNMGSMFLSCSSLESLDLSNFDTGNVTDMNSMFHSCSSLESLDLSNFDTGNVTNMSYMFLYCLSLESLDLSSFDTGNVTNMNTMFIDCSNLTTIYAGSGWSTAKLTAFNAAFPGCTSLVGGNGTALDPSQITIEYARIDRDGEPGYLTGVFTLALPDDVTTTATPTLVHGDVSLYAGGTEVTIAYGGEVPEGKIVVYTVNGTDFVGDSFEMPYDDATVTVAVTDPPRYVFNRTTGTLTLYWGEFNKDDKWGDDVPAADVLSVTATDQVSFTGDCSQMFKNFSNCTSIDLSQVNTDDCTDMSEMFGNCKAVTTLDLSNWNTANVTNMTYMFAVCQSLESLDVSNWNTASVTDMQGMFIYCSALESLDILNFDIGKVTDMSNMFNSCSGLKSLDLSNWNTAAVTTMNNMFIYCSALESLDLSGWANSSVTDMTNMFLNCSSLETLDVSNWNTASVTNMNNMFNSCSGLTTLDLSSWNTAAVTTTYAMFVNCSNLTTIYAGAGWNTENITYSGSMFFNCTSLVGGNGTTYDPNHTDAEYAHFDRGEEEPGYLTGVFTLALPDDVTTSATPTLVHGDVNLYAGGTDITLSYSGEVPEGKILGYSVNGTDIEGDTFEMPFEDATVTLAFTDPPRYVFNSTTGALTLFWGEFNKDDKWGDDVPAADVLSVTATDQVSFTGVCSQLFQNFSNCESMTLGNVNTEDCTDMSQMFYDCESLTTLDVSNWNTGNVTDMHDMFAWCESLTTLDLSGWNTAKVTDMNYMFFSCKALEALDVTGFDTGNVIDMGGMFGGCEALGSIDVTGFDTGNVTDMRAMFIGCKSLETVDVTGFDTSNATSMDNMFAFCDNLQSLDLSNFDTGNVTDMIFMFIGCENLTTIIVGEGWNTENVTGSYLMFQDCTSLVGGMGTTYDSGHVDVEYAHVDGGTDNPGYLTAAKTTFTLAEVVADGKNGDNVTLSDALAVVQKTEDGVLAYVTDGNDHWARLEGDAVADLVAGSGITGVGGTLANMGTAPTIILDDAPAEADAPDYQIATIDLQHSIADLPAPCQVVSVSGFYDGLKVRAYRRAPQGQGLLINADHTSVAMEVGKRYDIVAAIELLEPWDNDEASGAPRRVKPTDDNFLDNIYLMVVSGEENPETGIDDIAADYGKEVEAIYTVDGMRVDRVTEGVYIIQFKDGSVMKVLF